jgi:murein DD-endopeptidase MepM/ murein hydrolase activator NlpD
MKIGIRFPSILIITITLLMGEIMGESHIARAAPGKRGIAPTHTHGKGKQGPLQCLGSGIQTYGHALVITPKLKKKLDLKDRKRLAALASQDTVQLGHLETLFPSASKQYLVDIKLSETATVATFASIKNFIKTGQFLGPVKLRVGTVVDKEDAKADKLDIEKTVNELNEMDLVDQAKNIRHKWMATGTDDPTAVFELQLTDRTVLAAIQMHDGTEDCLTVDMDIERPILVEGVDQKYIPENYLFNLPIAPPFLVSYFYGPRIFNSMNVSIGMQRNEPKTPKSLARNTKESLEYLNKYWQFHSGIDFSVPSGTPVYAPYDGHVFAMGKMGCAGNTLVISHTISGSNNLVFSVYEHLMDSKNLALVVLKGDVPVRLYKPGEKLERGERTRRLQIGDPVFQGSFIAKSGASGSKIGFSKGFKEGCVGGAHLHFELRVPKESSAAAAREFASENKSKKIHDMGMRFRFVEVETVAINPADYIHGLDQSCQERKDVEIRNAKALLREDKKAVPPMTAGLCSYKYETSLKKVPPIYRLTRQKNGAEPPIGLRNPAKTNLL